VKKYPLLSESTGILFENSRGLLGLREGRILFLPFVKISNLTVITPS
jgi:hypothetical protein